MRNNLKKAREKHENLKQYEVAKILGISERQYQHIEAGTRGTTSTNWLKLYELFDQKVLLHELMQNTKEYDYLFAVSSHICSKQFKSNNTMKNGKK